MRRIQIASWTTPDRLTVTEGPPPACGEREVRIRVQAVAITYSLWLLIQGKYQRKPPFPFIPGGFVAGYVAELGPGASRFHAGDRVIATLEIGGLAEEAVAPEACTYAIPGSLPFVKANALNCSYSSVTAALTWPRSLHIQRGETLLVHGAAGNVGGAAVEIGRTLGATVIATASTPEKREWTLKRGAAHALESDPERLRDRVMEITSGRGVDAVLDPVGGRLFDASLRCLRADGRITPLGFACGEIPRIPANLVLVKNLSVSGINMGYYKLRERTRYEPMIRAMFAQLAEWFEQGHIDPVTSAVFPLERAPDAFSAVMSRSKIGHVVVVMDEEAGRLGISRRREREEAS